MLTVLLSSLAAMAGREIGDEDYSGWLKDYDSLIYSEETKRILFLQRG